MQPPSGRQRSDQLVICMHAGLHHTKINDRVLTQVQNAEGSTSCLDSMACTEGSSVAYRDMSKAYFRKQEANDKF